MSGSRNFQKNAEYTRDQLESDPDRRSGNMQSHNDAMYGRTEGSKMQNAQGNIDRNQGEFERATNERYNNQDTQNAEKMNQYNRSRK